jgi:hypothetical protein
LSPLGLNFGWLVIVPLTTKASLHRGHVSPIVIDYLE